MSEAEKIGTKTIALTCNHKAAILEEVGLGICVEVGPEVIAGSSRMKAGTAQKMVLNMLTTGAMIKIGKTYENFMIDLMPTNEKLKDRAIRIVSEIAEVSAIVLQPIFSASVRTPKRYLGLPLAEIATQTSFSVNI